MIIDPAARDHGALGQDREVKQLANLLPWMGEFTNGALDLCMPINSPSSN